MTKTSIQELITTRFENVCLDEETNAKLTTILTQCNEDEQFCMKYLYAFMLDQDIASYEPALYLQFVKHALKTKQETPWGNQLDAHLFLNYVLPYRINTENIEFCRDMFFNEIYPRIKDLSMYDAVLEVNYWCFEKATYQSTDSRTASPLTVLRNTYGRCGEESTLAVTALRSVGIPARQVYTPRWAHCDDNHAWVEVFVDGKWHFFGACEPEATLDTGWFVTPASRGMLIHNRLFSTITGDEIITEQTEFATEINLLKNYAKTKKVTITVKDEQGQPVQDAFVSFEVVNYAHAFPLARIQTNELGEASLLTGLGDLLISVNKGDAFVMEKLDVRVCDQLDICLIAKPFEETVEHYTLVPPVAGESLNPVISEDVKAIHQKKVDTALTIREAYKATFLKEETALNKAKAYAPYEKEVATFLEKSNGNYVEILNFLDDEQTVELLEYKVKLLNTLRLKDYSDVLACHLLNHLTEAMKWVDFYDDTTFVDHILCPHIELDMITSYRTYIRENLEQDLKQTILTNPIKGYQLLTERIVLTDEQEIPMLCADLVGTLKLRRANKRTRKTLFVAICRSLGLPASINKKDRSINCFFEDQWLTLDAAKEIPKENLAILQLINETKESEMQYHRNISVERFENGRYHVLNLGNIEWDQDTVAYELQSGYYRVTTANRQLDGTLRVRFYYIQLNDQKIKSLTIGLSAKVEQALAEPVNDVNLLTTNHETVKLSQLVAQKNIIAFLDASLEPTEHLLNEMIDNQDAFNQTEANVIFIVTPEQLENAKLKRVLELIPTIQVYYKQDSTYEASLFTQFKLPSKELPLVYILTNDMNIQYVWSGYNIGLGETLIECLAL